MMNTKKYEMIDDKKLNLVYITQEEQLVRQDSTIKRLWIALVVAILMIAATNVAWLIYISQFDFESYDYDQDGEGINIIGDGNGASYNGSKIESQEKDVEEPESGQRESSQAEGMTDE